jgi:hypothetical protein
MGMTCGLGHPFECFLNYIRTLSHLDYRKVPKLEEEAYEAMIEFMKNTAADEYEEKKLQKLDVIKLNEMIDIWYRKNKCRCEK